RAISAAQDGQEIVSRGFIIELLKKHNFFFADLGPQQSVEQMLRAQVLNRLVAGTLQGNRTDKKFVFRGNVHAKAFIVAGHVKDRLTNDWRLANHADLRGTLGKKKSLYLVVLLDDAAVFRAGRGLEFDSGIDALHRAGKFVVFFEQFFAIGITYDRL